MTVFPLLDTHRTSGRGSGRWAEGQQVGIVNSFEMVHPDRQSGCNGHCSAYSPLHRAVPPSFCENPVLLRDPSVDGAAT